MTYTKSLERFPTLRQSRLSTFDSCALRAHLEEEHRRGWSGHPAARGQIMHRTFARALRVMNKQNEGSIPTDAMLEILFDALRQDDVDRACPHCGREIAERGRSVDDAGVASESAMLTCAAGHTFRSDFANIPAKEIKDMRWVAIKWAAASEANPYDIANLVDIEQRLSHPILYADGDSYVKRVLTGQLDAMFVTGQNDEEAIVLDWKDTYDMPGPSDVGFEGYFQQRFYAWLVMKHFPAIQRVTLREVYVRYSAEREASVFREDLEAVEAELSALAERFDRAFHEGNFPPSPGRHCVLCPRPGSCPIFPGVREQGAITDDIMARRVAGEAMVAKRALKQRQDALRAWAGGRGSITINSTPGRERVWGFRESRRTSRPTREELEQAMRGGGRLSQERVDALYKESVVAKFEPHRPIVEEPSQDDEDLADQLRRSIEQAGGSVREEQ